MMYTEITSARFRSISAFAYLVNDSFVYISEWGDTLEEPSNKESCNSNWLLVPYHKVRRDNIGLGHPLTASVKCVDCNCEIHFTRDFTKG